jgi:hypothetical protein
MVVGWGSSFHAYPRIASARTVTLPARNHPNFAPPAPPFRSTFIGNNDCHSRGRRGWGWRQGLRVPQQFKRLERSQNLSSFASIPILGVVKGSS